MYDLSISQTKRELQFHSPLGPDVLLPVEMRGQERLAEPYCYEIDLVSSKRDLRPADLLGKAVSLRLVHDGSPVREFNGLVTRLQRCGAYDDLQRYRHHMRHSHARAAFTANPHPHPMRTVAHPE